MKPNKEFIKQPMDFWANIRTISQKNGYTIRGENRIKVPTINEIENCLKYLSLRLDHIVKKDKLTIYGKKILDYFKYRAKILNEYVEPLLMDVEEAKENYKKLIGKYNPKAPMPLNKQKGNKKSPAYLTCIINMIIEATSKGYNCDYDPRELTTVTRNGYPLRTLSRRVDGAFPNAVNPIAIWEIKEYYYTTTFGSRVADGVYETLLDGMELEELYEHEKIEVLHYLMIDSHFTWWVCGKAYLCRIIDMLHMGYVDEVIFGKEVITTLPKIVKNWIKKLK